MKKIILTLSILFFTTKVFSQTSSCDEVLDFITTNGYYKASLASYTLNSSWLYKVTAYTYEYKTYVIAEIKKDEYAITTKKYIFCDIPSSNWINFQIGAYGDSNSYGERFHKYIMDYKCDCN
ncbi:hypothetical protein FRZ67_16020 [Panacibacter ginsenosidivorans]|uniref:KTSC domain-containing protein n=1 Tax=Panacibacter ginsenosidivorans TaxID=1813871 RepID=A0A5B8VB59_9BACT|nr:hypothetical protein [Panacibacter ginsenosidivorans]QEC68737.1 hypothetical protein FRZ67_16020 [Panacibacter ginsenosidivorans]